MECSPEIDDPVPDSTGEEESVSNKLKMADCSGMASEVLEGGRQGQTDTHTLARMDTRMQVHMHAPTHTRMHTHIRGARGDHLPPSRLLKTYLCPSYILETLSLPL